MITMPHQVWQNIMLTLTQEYINEPSVLLIRSKMKRVLGFTQRYHKQWVENKMQEELHLKELAEKHPAIADAVAQVQEAEDRLRVVTALVEEENVTADIEDKKLLELYLEYMNMHSKMLDKHEAVAIAGVLVTQALSLYRTVLDQNDFDHMMDNISQKRDQIKPMDLTKVLLH